MDLQPGWGRLAILLVVVVVVVPLVLLLLTGSGWALAAWLVYAVGAALAAGAGAWFASRRYGGRFA